MKTRSGRGKKSLEPVRRSPAKRRKRPSKRQRQRQSGLVIKPENQENETIVLSDSEGDENQPNNNGCVEDDIQVIDIADITQEVAAPHVSVNVSKCLDNYVTAQPATSASPKPKPVVFYVNQEVAPPSVSNANVSKSIGDYVTATTQPSTSSPKPVVFGRPSGNNTSSDPPVIILGDEPDLPVPDDDGVEVVAVVVSSRQTGRSLNRRKSTSLSQMQEAIKKAKSTIRRQSSSRNPSPSRHVLNGIAANSRQIQKSKKWKKQKRSYQNNQQFQGINAFQRNRRQEDQRRVVYRIDNHRDGAGPWERIGGNAPTMQNRNANFSFEAIPFIPFASSTPAPRRPNVVRDRCGPWSRPRLPLPSGSNQMNPPRHPIPSIAPGSNIMTVGDSGKRQAGSLRPIVIDGSNVAVGHGKMLRTNKFSAKGIQICVDYFLKRGHNEIFAFAPRHFLKKSESLDPELLEKIEKDGYVRFTPSREVGVQRISSYDDL
ncbi:putative ribonuclease ZC3H12C [Orchesella cincta]|uniref:Putative ribonuclease ZC3H12C n=1 Tax=Orchesella cincta TaxID=48709 RepID=A0A1D2MTC7_ORCCI|nr:putative ribonuclease ZC3H12C [Orchesella cincta]